MGKKKTSRETKITDVLEYYKIAVELHNAESQRYWDRNNVFILINGAFIAFLGTDLIEGKIDRLIICCIGFFASYMWILILRQGKDLIERWRKVLHWLENGNDEIMEVFQTADKLSSEGKPLFRLPFSRLQASGVMRWAAILVCTGWLMAFAGIYITDEKNAKNENETITKECPCIQSK